MENIINIKIVLTLAGGEEIVRSRKVSIHIPRDKMARRLDSAFDGLASSLATIGDIAARQASMDKLEGE